MNQKTALSILRTIGGLTAVSGLIYGNLYGKIGYLFSSVGFLMITASVIINERSTPTKQ